MGTARFIKQKNGQGDGRVYALDPPMPVHVWGADHGDECTCAPTSHVWISAAVVPYSGPETCIFPCDADGDVTDWGELDGSYRGGLDHEAALESAGYEVSA